MTNDAFRFCVYCEADCYVDEPEHAVDCPSSTRVFPVREKDLMPCVNCGHHLHGMRCMDCEAELSVGDHYMHREVDHGDPLLPGIECAPVFEVICVGCAAKEHLA